MRQGALLEGRYELTGSLGQGGMGEVWAARDQKMQREVAVKFVSRTARDETLLLRFRREIRAAAQLPGRYTAVAHDWGAAEIDGVHMLYMVMERLPGPTLQEAVKAERPRWRTAVSWARQVAAALDGAHRRGIVHRDVKPNNVMFTEEGELKVLDFGIAKFFGDTLREGGLTLTGLPLGTPAYMSPEQAKGVRTVDHRSDLYSLGALLYFLLTGRAPVTGDNAWAITYQVIQGEIRPVHELVPEIPHELAALVMELLAREADDRPASATVVLKRLDGFGAPAADRLLDDAQAFAAELRARTEREVAAVRAAAQRDAQQLRERADLLFEETRTKAAQAAMDFETNLAKRRQQAERDLAARQAKAEKRLAEIEHRAEELRLEAEKLRTDAERRARTIVNEATARAAEQEAATEGVRVRLHEVRAEITETLDRSMYQPVDALGEQRARIIGQLTELAEILSTLPDPAFAARQGADPRQGMDLAQGIDRRLGQGAQQDVWPDLQQEAWQGRQQ
ncbi:protein kinase [Streptomyces sp. NPDC004327]|uniref:serine/threonine-protein kinase n=1 Tax=Streptomyces sp. NPDC004327 TaxID=3364699 RepID=UPI003686A296